MADIVTLAELRTKIRVSSGSDAELTQIILEAESLFQGLIGQKLIATAYTEVRTGNGGNILMLQRYPVIAITSITIEGESAINPLDAMQVRYKTGQGSDGVLYLITRSWSRAYPFNVTIDYTAGFADQPAIKAAMEDAWAVVLDRAAVLWFDAQVSQKGVQAQSYMDGSITYMAEPAWRRKHEQRWRDVVEMYARRQPSVVTAW